MATAATTSRPPTAATMAGRPDVLLASLVVPGVLFAAGVCTESAINPCL